MQLLDYIQVKTNKGFADIELYQGDLSAIPKEYEVDILILSAFPNDYTPLPHSLIGALHNRGLSVEELAKEKDIDQRKNLWCWFSKELSREQIDKFHFHRILCFEPESRKDDAAEYVADIFRCLNNFVFDDDVNHVAMSTVASGTQLATASKITESILEAAIFWLQRGLPLQSIKLVEIDEKKAKDLKKVFARFKNHEQLDTTIEELVKKEEVAAIGRSQNGGTAVALPSRAPAVVETIAPAPVPVIAPTPTVITETPVAADHFDFFISYAHKNKDHVRYFIEKLKAQHPNLRLFYDSDSIPKGGQWLKQISKCIDKSKKVLIFLSKEFDDSPACWDEFQCAKVRQNRTGRNVIMNIYLHNHPELPSIFEIFNWIDCREGDKQKLEVAIADIVSALEDSGGM